VEEEVVEPHSKEVELEVVVEEVEVNIFLVLELAHIVEVVEVMV